MAQTKGKNVRLTNQAHILCSEKAEDFKTSMKAVASEAIFLLVRGEDRDKEQQESIEIYKKRVAVLSKRIQEYASFYIILGSAAGFCLGIIIGVIL